jgi:predicted RNA binding protein YcfA (HicA-like mRNA interferase family)
LSTVTAKAMTRALLRAGFIELRQRGSHRIFASGTRRAIVPMHGGDLKPGTLKTILDAAGLTSEQLRDLL